MFIRKTLFLSFICIFLSGCSKFKTYMRTQPKLKYEDGLLVSNSQTNPYKFSYENGVLLINYSIVVKNISEKTIDINLESAFYEANDEKKSLGCELYNDKKKIVSLESAKQVAVACHAELIPNQVNKLSLRDTDIKLSIPLNHSWHSFAYRVYSEELR